MVSAESSRNLNVHQPQGRVPCSIAIGTCISLRMINMVWVSIGSEMPLPHRCSAMNIRNMLLLLLLLAATGVQAAVSLVSGPPAGTRLPQVLCYASTGPQVGQESFDVSTVIGNGPGALLFVHVLNRNTAPVLRGMDKLTTELGLFGFKGFVIMMTSDRTAGEEQLKRVNGSLKLHHPMVLGLDGLDGPGGLALNRRCTLSLIVVNDGKVKESIGITDTGLHDLETIRTAFEAAIGGIPTRPAELLAMARRNLPEGEAAVRELAARQAVELYQLRKQASEEYGNSSRYPSRQENMRGRKDREGGMREKSMAEGGRESRATREAPAKAKESESVSKVQRRGGPPSDPELNTLLRSFIRRENPDDLSDQVFISIEARSAESEDLMKQAVAMFQLMLSYPDRYGSEHAQGLARQFLSKHEKSK